MDTSGKILMIGGGLLAVVVAGLVSFLLGRQPATTTILQSPTAVAAGVIQGTAPVLVATQRIPRGTELHANDASRLFRVLYYPKNEVATQSVFADAHQLSALLSVTPRTTTRTIEQGEQLSAPLLSGMAAPSRGGAVAAALSQGFDAETITVTVPSKAVGNAIAVNDRVDVIYSAPPAAGDASGEPARTGMLVQGATVVAVGAHNAYTLALTPEDTVRLTHVEDAGWSLHLVVRSAFDGATTRSARDVSAGGTTITATSGRRR